MMYIDPFDLKEPWLSYPASLAECLSRLTKQQLINICKMLKLGGYSRLNKSGLVEKVECNMLSHFNEIFRTWDMHRVQIIQKAVENNGLVMEIYEDWDYYEYFTDRGLLFPTIINDHEMYIMPEELVAWFNEAGIMNVQEITQRNTEWIKLTMGLTYRYGALTYSQLKEFVFKYAERRTDAEQFWQVIRDAAQYYEEIEIAEEENIISYYSNEYPESTISEHLFRSQLEFYPFTRKQLLQAGEPDYQERSKHYMQLKRYLMSACRMSEDEADILVEECELDIQNLATLPELIEGISDWIDFTSLAEAQALTDKLVDLINNTRQWALKGYTPDELSRNRERGISNVLSHMPVQSSKPAVLSHMPAPSGRADVISFETKKKIGRNDPCPCKSGEKFKKCCGR